MPWSTVGQRPQRSASLDRSRLGRLNLQIPAFGFCCASILRELDFQLPGERPEFQFVVYEKRRATLADHNIDLMTRDHFRELRPYSLRCARLRQLLRKTGSLQTTDLSTTDIDHSQSILSAQARIVTVIR